MVGLYPHIPHGEGLDSMKEILNEFKGKVNYGEWYVDGVDLVEMATIILENNYFEFDGQIYWQKQGTAIGTKFAPAYANIFMYVLETRMLGICEFRPWIWWRFLDDVFLIWLHGEDRLKEFLEFINSFHKTIKYTWDYSTSKASYLDVSIYKERGSDICTDVYSKPTDTHQYLDSKFVIRGM